jgi:chromosome segregation ATPase
MLDPELVTYLDRRFDTVDQRFDTVDQRFEAIDRKFEAIDRKFEAIDGKFEALDGKFEALDGKFEAIDRKVDDKVGEVRVLLEHLDTKIQLVAEGVVANNQALEAFRREVAFQFEEVRAVNRLSYVELERKIAALRG